jgi:hypothetical protein
VKHLEPVADLAWVKRQLEKRKKMGGVNVQDKYAILEIANKLPFAFMHKIVLEEQRLQENSEGAITVMMSGQGRGSKLHVAREMSVPEGDLYYNTAYIDGQKVTANDETLVRMSTYSTVQRRMLTVALALMQSESERNMRHFAGVIEKIFLKGWEGKEGDNGFWEKIEGFGFNPYKFCSDAASGQKKALQGAFKGFDGRGEWVDCEMHFMKSLRDAEKNLPQELRLTHRLLVRMMLVSETEEQWGESFDKLVDWYDNNLGMRSTARKKMINWGVFWRYK